MFGVGREKSLIPGIRNVASGACAYGHGRYAMNCPLKSEETIDVLLDYSAGRLDAARSTRFEQHRKTCADCETFLAGQTEVWQTLDEWQPEAVSLDFNRRLWQRID